MGVIHSINNNMLHEKTPLIRGKAIDKLKKRKHQLEKRSMKGIFKSKALWYFDELKENVCSQSTKSFTISEGRLRKEKSREKESY